MIQLGDICTKASSNIAQKDLEDCDGIYPIYGASGLIKYIDFYQQPNPYVAVVKDGAGVGRIMLLPAKSSVIGTMQYILPNKGTNVAYLAYAMEHMGLAKYYTGATIPHIYFKDYCKELLREHCESEQQEIAAVLDKLTGLISLRKQQLAKLDELVKSRFVEMFGDPTINSLGWPVRKFKDISIVITDGEHITPRRKENGIYLLSARNILNHMLNLDNVDYIDNDEYNRIARRIIPQKGDVLISCSGSIGRCCVVPDRLKFQMVRSVALVRFNSNINPIFAEWLIVSDELQRQISNSATQSSQANLFQGKIRELRGYVPPKDLQDLFAAFVSQVNESKSKILKALAQLETLKKSLMQQYFS